MPLEVVVVRWAVHTTPPKIGFKKERAVLIFCIFDRTARAWRVSKDIL